MPARRQLPVVGHRLPRLEGEHMSGGQGATEELPVENGHRPGSPVLHLGGLVELTDVGPSAVAVMAIDVGEGKGAGVELAVVEALVAVEPGAVRIRSALPETAALPDVDKAFLRANDASRAVCAIIISVLSDP